MDHEKLAISDSTSGFDAALEGLDGDDVALEGLDGVDVALEGLDGVDVALEGLDSTGYFWPSVKSFTCFCKSPTISVRHDITKKLFSKRKLQIYGEIKRFYLSIGVISFLTIKAAIYASLVYYLQNINTDFVMPIALPNVWSTCSKMKRRNYFLTKRVVD